MKSDQYFLNTYNFYNKNVHTDGGVGMVLYRIPQNITLS